MEFHSEAEKHKSSKITHPILFIAKHNLFSLPSVSPLLPLTFFSFGFLPPPSLLLARQHHRTCNYRRFPAPSGTNVIKSQKKTHWTKRQRCSRGHKGGFCKGGGGGSAKATSAFFGFWGDLMGFSKELCQISCLPIQNQPFGCQATHFSPLMASCHPLQTHPSLSCMTPSDPLSVMDCRLQMSQVSEVRS